KIVGEVVARVRVSTETRDARLVELGCVLILAQLAAEMARPLPELLTPGRLLVGPPGRTPPAAESQMENPLQPLCRLVLSEPWETARPVEGLVVLREHRVSVFERRGAGLERVEQHLPRHLGYANRVIAVADARGEERLPTRLDPRHRRHLRDRQGATRE